MLPAIPERMNHFKTTLFAVALGLAIHSGASAQHSQSVDAPEAPPSAESPPSGERTAAERLADPGTFRIGLQGYIGSNGRTSVFAAGAEQTERLTATFGFQAQGLAPIGKYVLVGPAFSLRSTHGWGASQRLSVYGFDLAFGAHYGVALSNSVAIDPYVLFTLGLAVAGAQSNGFVEETAYGVGVGVRAGATLWFDHAFGARFGVGHQSIHLFPGADTRIRFREFAFELGITFRFGSSMAHHHS